MAPPTTVAFGRHLSAADLKSTREQHDLKFTFEKQKHGDTPYYLQGNADFNSTMNEQARAALKHFALKWQLQAENVRNQMGNDKTQLEYATLLEARAENLFELEMNERLWQQG